MKRIFSLFLALLFVFGTMDCGVFTAAYADGEPVAAEETAPLSEPAAEPAAEQTPVSEASLKWRAFDTDLIYYLLKEDVSSMNQMFKFPGSLNMREEDVVITLGSYDKSEYDRYFNDMKAFLDRLDEIDRDQLLPEEQYAYDAVRTEIEWELDGEEFYGYFEPLEAFSGIQADLPIVFWLYDIRNEKDAETYLALMETVPEFMTSLLRYEQYRVELGIFMPESSLDKVESDMEAVLSTGKNMFLISSFEKALNDIPELSEERRAELKKRNKELVKNAFLGGYQLLYDGIEKLRPYCRSAVGISELGNDTYSRYYEYFLRVTCGDDASVKRAASLMERYIIEDWSAAYDMYLDGTDFYEGKLSLGSVEKNMKYLRELNADTLPEVPAPEITYHVIPEEMHDVFAPAAYLVAALDDPSHVTIILNDPNSDNNLLRTLAHEGWYGHLYQYAGIRSRNKSLSQQFLQNTAYSEAFSQMGEFFFAAKTKKYNSQSLLLGLYEEWMQTEMLTYCSILVNGLGYSKAKLKSQLKAIFGYDAGTAEAVYGIVVQAPFYYVPYAYGLARFRYIYEELGYTDWGSFYEDCFSVGPTYFHLLEEACRERNGLPAAVKAEEKEKWVPFDGIIDQEEIGEEEQEAA